MVSAARPPTGLALRKAWALPLLAAAADALQQGAHLALTSQPQPEQAPTMRACVVTRANTEPCPPGIGDEGVADTVARMQELGCGLDAERIQVLTEPRPTPSAGQALVRVAYSSVNPVNWKTLLSNPPLVTYPYHIGMDFAGTVESVGSSCDLAPGDEVWGMGDGAYAEYMVVYCTRAGRKPTALGMLQAGVLPLVSLTGLEGLQWAGAPWTSGPTVLVLGGSGGTGSAGVQLAKALGAARVITTCSPDNAEYVRRLGADEVIDYHTQNWWEVLSAGSVDVIYDCVCLAGTGEHAYEILADGGRFVTIQMRPLASAATAASRPSVQQHAYILSQTGRGQLDILAGFANAGHLNTTIDSVFELDEVPQAFTASMTAHTVGKIAIDAQA